MPPLLLLTTRVMSLWFGVTFAAGASGLRICSARPDESPKRVASPRCSAVNAPGDVVVDVVPPPRIDGLRTGAGRTGFFPPTRATVSVLGPSGSPAPSGSAARSALTSLDGSAGTSGVLTATAGGGSTLGLAATGGAGGFLNATKNSTTQTPTSSAAPAASFAVRDPGRAPVAAAIDADEKRASVGPRGALGCRQLLPRFNALSASDSPLAIALGAAAAATAIPAPCASEPLCALCACTSSRIGTGVS